MESINLNELREQNHQPKNPFEHQKEAFTAFDAVFTFSDTEAKSGLLVLPTGAGKTYTVVNWLCDKVLSRNIKILWLAHSFYLLDQAFLEFCQNAEWIPKRETLNIRRVSSNPAHDNASSIQLTDDIVIMSTQTAIRNLHTEALDSSGKKMTTNFKKFIEHCKQTWLFVVLDEAHHAPAYGCRNLLIGTREPTLGIRELVPNLYLMGLTATPTYTDETRRGWLGKIFRNGKNGIIYKAEKSELIAKGILAIPKYIEMPTGREFEVDDSLYNRLVREHKGLPEYIIAKLADDQQRNDYIVNEYVKNRNRYGKTIIFADRWFQCVYLKEKLREKGIKADAIYSKIDADPGSAEARNQRTSSDNARILNEFKNNELDVLINVRMLTEGVDVPDVRTIFITRQTTSSILMTQMIGRALRGKRAGGNKSEANIVLFVDEWKRLIDWAIPSLEGVVEPDKPVTRYYPLEYISIRLVEELSRQINTGEPQSLPFSQFIPTGWYQTEITVNTSEDDFDGMQSFVEFVMVYEHTKPKFDAFMKMISENLSNEWAKEYLSQKWMLPQIEQWLKECFDRENDDIGNILDLNLIKIVRHIAQKQTIPIYYPFEERDKYDLDKLAEKLIRMNALEQKEVLSREFSKPGNLWKVFYKSFSRFHVAFFGALARLLHKPTDPSPPLPPPPRRVKELTEAEKKQVKTRDNNTCLSCGAKGSGIRLEIDHILPFIMGGETSVDNSQALCSICNNKKGINEINFRYNPTQLSSPKELDLLPRYGTENVKLSITRLVNFFYHCRAVCQVDLDKTRGGKYYYTWEIELYDGNNPEWLLKHKMALIKHIQNNFSYSHVRDLKIYGVHQPKLPPDTPPEPTQDDTALISITQRGFIKRVPITAYPTGETNIAIHNRDVVETLLVANAADTILFFTDREKIYAREAHQIPIDSQMGQGMSAAQCLNLARGEKVISTVAVPGFDPDEYLVMLTPEGQIKRTHLQKFASIRRSGLNIGAKIDWAKLIRNHQELVVVSRNGQAIRFEVSDIQPRKGLTAGSVKAIQLQRQDKMAGMDIVDPNADLLVVTTRGFAKRTPLNEYNLYNRGGKGMRTLAENIKKTGDIVAAHVVSKQDNVILISKDGIMLQTEADKISEQGRTTQGRRMIELKRNDAVAAVVVFAPK